ncbi:MAG: citrate lyase acyl carrier protein [Lutibacter sp.]|uniref:citrate lyase acyl carrier protein n=1 Tax=Lutibacter sp. TaxID=1925666 RepID=UPI00385C2423
MKIVKKAQAGSFESSDILILAEKPKDTKGRVIQLNSIVEKQYGDMILKTVNAVLDKFEIADIHLVIHDKGALTPVIEARMETVLLRASNNQKGTLY